MTKKFYSLAAAFLVLAIAGQAQASHIFTTDILINGTPVAITNSFTDPVITTTVGTPVTFDIGMYGAAGELNISFVAQVGSTLAAPVTEVFNFGGGGSFANPIRHTFTRTFATAGEFDGYFLPDFLSSTPNYRFPNGSGTTDPQIPIRIVVNSATSPVPEPASVVMLVTGGLGLVGGAIRRRRAKKSLAV